MFDDDATQAKIMKETNPYRIKRLGNKVRNFSNDQWKRASRQVMHKAISAKFLQNNTLMGLLLSTGQKIIAEGTTDPFWGIGLRLHDKAAMDQCKWPNREGGVISNILQKVHSELRNN